MVLEFRFSIVVYIPIGRRREHEIKVEVQLGYCESFLFFCVCVCFGGREAYLCI